MNWIEAVTLAVLLIAPPIILVGVFRFPRWFVRSLYGHQIWELRDRIVDDALSGELDKDHPAVRELITRADRQARHCHQTDIVQVTLFNRALSRSSKTAREQVRKLGSVSSDEGLDAKSQQRMAEHLRNLEVLMIGSIMLGSWVGLVLTLRYFPQAYRQARKDRLENSEAGIQTAGINAAYKAGRPLKDVILAGGSLESRVAV